MVISDLELVSAKLSWNSWVILPPHAAMPNLMYSSISDPILKSSGHPSAALRILIINNRVGSNGVSVL